jgi:hypothetical protein
MKYYSPSTKGFYDKDFHGNNIPEDVIEIADDHYKYLIDNQSGDKLIDVVNGEVVLLDRVITQEELDNQYKIDRRREYPDFKDYLDGIVKGDQAQVQAYIDACLAVKAKYPKGQ